MERPPTFTARLSGRRRLSAAGRAGRGGHVLREPFAIPVGIGFGEIVFQKAEDARETQAGRSSCPRARALRAAGVSCRAFAVARSVRRRIAVEDQVLHARAGEFFERRRRDRSRARTAASSSVRFKLAEPEPGPRPPSNKRPRPIHDHLGGIEIVFRAQAIAGGARAVGRIEAEGARLELRARRCRIRCKPAFRRRLARCRPPRKR